MGNLERGTTSYSTLLWTIVAQTGNDRRDDGSIAGSPHMSRCRPHPHHLSARDGTPSTSLRRSTGRESRRRFRRPRASDLEALVAHVSKEPVCLWSPSELEPAVRRLPASLPSQASTTSVSEHISSHSQQIMQAGASSGKQSRLHSSSRASNLLSRRSYVPFVPAWPAFEVRVSRMRRMIWA